MTKAVLLRPALVCRSVFHAAVRVVIAMGWVIICLVYVLLSPPAWGQAASPPRLVLVASPSARLLVARVGQELSTMGFEPVLESLDSVPVDSLGALARSTHAAVAVRIEMLESGVRVWVFDRATGKTLTREVRASAAGTNPALHNLAIHVVELLRASLLELQLDGAPRGDLAPSPALLEASRIPVVRKPARAAGVEVVAAPTQSIGETPYESGSSDVDAVGGLSIEFGAAWVKGVGDIESYPALQTALHVFLAREWRLGLVGFVPLNSAQHASTSGQSRNRVTWFGLEGYWQRADGSLRPFVGLGLGAAILETHGTANTIEFEGERNRALAPGALLRSGLGVSLTQHLQVKPHVTLGVQSHYFAIDYGAQASARWGPWWGVLSLALAGEFVE